MTTYDGINSSNGIHISLEGISGCGKSFILSKLREVLQEQPLTIVEEIEDRQADYGRSLDQKIVALLHNSEDHFFRGGHPRMETLLLLALQAYDAEALIAPALARGEIVIEDRSLDTIAVYQALILHPSESPERQLAYAHRLYQFACQWRQPPHLTFLLEEDFSVALERSQQRLARTYTAEDVLLLRMAAALYTQYAQGYPDRIRCLDRRILSVDDIVCIILDAILS